MIPREEYLRQFASTSQANVYKNALLIHDRLEQEVRLLANRDYPFDAIEVSTTVFMTENAANAVQDPLTLMLSPSGWTLNREMTPTDKFEFDLPIFQVKWLMAK
jgi:hypothetical protein